MCIAIEIANSSLTWRAWLYLQTFPNIICSFSGPISNSLKARDKTSINFNAFGADSQGRACGTLSPGIFSMFMQSDFQQQRKNWTRLQNTLIIKVSSYWKCLCDQTSTLKYSLFTMPVLSETGCVFLIQKDKVGGLDASCCGAWQVSRAQEEAGSLKKASCKHTVAN